MKILAPETLNATIQLPASKSICNRALIINALSGGGSRLDNIAECDDSNVVVRALQEMGDTIDIKAAGTAMRFLTALLAATDCGTHTITGTERMRQRPIMVLVDALLELGASITYTGSEGYPPLRISGRRLQGGCISLPGNVSSQYISALLMTGPTMHDGLRLRLTGDIISRPYIDMTVSIMRQFGAKAGWNGNDLLVVEPTGYTPTSYIIESDWSAASYWYETMALCNDEDARITLPGLFKESLQGDSHIASVFAKLGVRTEIDDHGAILTKQKTSISRLEIDMVTMPDLAQTLVVTCCMMGIPFHITGLQTLKIKETDRIVALQNEMAKLGFAIESHNDSELLWEKKSDNQGIKVPRQAIDTYDDHRMAMAFAPAAMKMEYMEINNPEVVSKSYPHFWENLSSAGFTISER